MYLSDKTQIKIFKMKNKEAKSFSELLKIKFEANLIKICIYLQEFLNKSST